MAVVVVVVSFSEASVVAESCDSESVVVASVAMSGFVVDTVAAVDVVVVETGSSIVLLASSISVIGRPHAAKTTATARNNAMDRYLFTVKASLGHSLNVRSTRKVGLDLRIDSQ